MTNMFAVSFGSVRLISPEELGDEIYADYVMWSSREKCGPSARREFLEEFDRKRREHELEGKIRKFGNRYFGIRLPALMLLK